MIDHPTGTVAGIYCVQVRKEPPTRLERVFALENFGLEGDAHAKKESARQVLLMDRETLDELGLKQGDLKENITTSGIPIASLEAGARVQVGEALFEITGPCPPCGKMESIRQGLRAELSGKRGMLARVIESGEIKEGDRIIIL